MKGDVVGDGEGRKHHRFTIAYLKALKKELRAKRREAAEAKQAKLATKGVGRGNSPDTHSVNAIQGQLLGMMKLQAERHKIVVELLSQILTALTLPDSLPISSENED